jgi:tetratricopeptide (TPR) repeat protein
MPLGWLDARQAVEVGTALADQYAPPTVAGTRAPARSASNRRDQAGALQELLRRAQLETQTLRLNFYQKAKFANTFKWRLLENGIEEQTADEVTRTLVLHLSVGPTADAAADTNAAVTPAEPAGTGTVRTLLGQGDYYMSRGAYAEAAQCYESMIGLHPRHAEALERLGAALCELGRFRDAEPCFRRAIRIRPSNVSAHRNLGTLLRWRGQLGASEHALRQALKLKPGDLEARSSLGFTLLGLGRAGEAKAQFEKALKSSPRHEDALFGMGQVARLEGRFDEAAALYERVLAANPKRAGALAALAVLRRMTSADRPWLQRAEELAGRGLSVLDEADLRFAIGKYYDDVGDYSHAFRNYQRANELQKSLAEAYDRAAQTRFVDDLIRIYSAPGLAQAQPGASSSERPIFVVGMMRSGTSLVEQIVASHPAVHGAGELGFWTEAVRRHDVAVRRGPLDEPLRERLATEYLRVLEGVSGSAQRVVDKAPINFEYLGVIHAVFPRARIIYVRRDPIDTCLSCYFQPFFAGLNYTMDLGDLAHYYREHQRLMAHWRGVLPAGSMLELPYAELVADQRGWTRRLLEFLGLEWDERCMEFFRTQRTVATASAWQVRQRIYTGSVERWRHYAKFIGPLRELKDLDS